MRNSRFSTAFARLLVAVVILSATTALHAQTVTDTLSVNLTQRVKITFKNGCQVYVFTIGTHPDPKGNGRDGDYTYFGFIRGTPRTFYYDPGVPADVGPGDSPGKYITYTVGLSYTLSPSGCAYDLPSRVALSMALDKQFARYSMPVGIYANFTSQSHGTNVCFDASNSFVLTKDGRRPVTSYSWDFGDGSVDTTGASATPYPCHTYSTPDIYYPKLTVRDAAGNSDTYDDIVVLTKGVLESDAKIDVQSAGKRSATEGSDVTAKEGDTLTVVGIVRNVGTADLLNVEVDPAFSFMFDIPDSLQVAYLGVPVLTPVVADDPPMTTRTTLAAGDSVEVTRRYIVEKFGTYAWKSTDQSRPVPMRIRPVVVRAVGVTTTGDTIRANDRCSGSTLGGAQVCDDQFITVGPKVTVDTKRESDISGVLVLHAPHPNPFNNAATITLDMPVTGRGMVAAYDALGRQVALLHEGELQAGTTTLRFDGEGIRSGIYVIQAQTSQGTQSCRVMLVR